MTEETEYQMHRRRAETLLEEFRKLGPGFVQMRDWVSEEVPVDVACANPCGTAACIGGKAGMMEVFREEGFYWTGTVSFRTETVFSVHPREFFGNDMHDAVFLGDWACDYVHTTRHVVLVLEAFLEDLDENSYGHFDEDWLPNRDVRDFVEDTQPEWKTFPVNDKRVGCGAYWVEAEEIPA